jgi:hypothetical protein
MQNDMWMLIVAGVFFVASIIFAGWLGNQGLEERVAYDSRERYLEKAKEVAALKAVGKATDEDEFELRMAENHWRHWDEKAKEKRGG